MRIAIGADHAGFALKQHLIETIASHSGFARGRKPFARRNQDVGEFREHGTFPGINTHTDTY